MEGLIIDEDQSGTAIKTETRVRYEMKNSGSWKIWHISPHDSNKGGGNKGIIYTSTDATGEYRNKTSEG